MNELIETTAAKVRVGFPLWLRPFLARGIVGITLGRRIYLTSDASGWSEADLERVVRHELAHVEQVLRMGLARFLAAYVGEYLAYRARGLGHRAAYEAIRFEREAREIEVAWSRDRGDPISGPDVDI